MQPILILDLGSSSTRAILYDLDDAALRPIDGSTLRVPVEFQTDAAGRSEDDANLALKRVLAVLEQTQYFCDQQGIDQVPAVGVASYASSLILLDAQGEPLTSVITYADTRAAEAARQLRREFDEIKTLQRTGCRIRANYAPARLLWLQQSQPALFERAAYFVSLSDYLRLKLTGTLSTSLSLAAWTGLVNRHSKQWDETWLKRLSIRRTQLPPIIESPIQISLLPIANARFLQDARWFPTLGDGAAANIGSGCTDASRIAVTIGTTAAMRIVTKSTETQLPPALWQYWVDGENRLIGGATSEGGNLMAWLRERLQLPEPAQLESAISVLPPDGHGLTILPLIAGERSPGYSDALGATLHGLTLSTTPVEIVRACMEAIAYRLALICDALRPFADAQPTLAASGGGLVNSPTWCQLIADVTGLPLRLSHEAEATARGVALLVRKQLQGVDHVAPTDEQAETTFLPNPATHATYRKAMQRQQRLYINVINN